METKDKPTTDRRTPAWKQQTFLIEYKKHHRFKVACAKIGVPMSAVIDDAIESFLATVETLSLTPPATDNPQS